MDKYLRIRSLRKLVLFILAYCFYHLGYSQQNAVRTAVLDQANKTITILTFDDYSDRPFQHLAQLTVDAHGVEYNVEINKTTSDLEIAAVQFRIKSFYSNNGNNNDPNRGVETILGEITEDFKNLYMDSPRRPSGNNYNGFHVLSLEVANLNSSIPPGDYSVQININTFEIDRPDRKIENPFTVNIQVMEIVEVAVEKFTVEPFIFNTFDRLENGINQDLFKVYLKTNKDKISRQLNIHAVFDDEGANSLENAVLGLRKKNSGAFHPVTGSSTAIGIEASTPLSEHVFELGVRPRYYMLPGNYNSQIYYTFTEP